MQIYKPCILGGKCHKSDINVGDTRKRSLVAPRGQKGQKRMMTLGTIEI